MGQDTLLETLDLSFHQRKWHPRADQWVVIHLGEGNCCSEAQLFDAKTGAPCNVLRGRSNPQFSLKRAFPNSSLFHSLAFLAAS